MVFFFQLFRNLCCFFLKAVPREQGTNPSLSGCPNPLPCSVLGREEGSFIWWLHHYVEVTPKAIISV